MRFIDHMVVSAALVLAVSQGVRGAGPVASGRPPAPASAPTAGAAGTRGGAKPSAPGASAPAMVAATGPSDAFTQELLKRLDSGDAGVRAAAQKELAAIAGYWQQPDMLQKMAEVTTDGELKGLLQKRADDLKAKQAVIDATHLPPISLSVKNATLPELVTALNDALNGPIKFTNIAGVAAAGAYTLDVKNKPFWEVFTALSEQKPLTIASTPAGMRLSSGIQSIRRYAIDGPVLAYSGNITYRRSIALQTAAGDQPVQSSLTAGVVMIVDPRLSVVRYRGLTGVKAIDDAGNNMARPNPAPAAAYMGTFINQLSQSLSLFPPDNLGKTMTLTFDTAITAAAGEQLTTIDDVQNNLNKAVTAGTRSFRVVRFDVQAGGTIAYQIAVTATQTVANPVSANVKYALLEGTGKNIWSMTTTGGVSGTISAGGASGPYKLEIRTSDQTVDIPVHVELKNIPLQ